MIPASRTLPASPEKTQPECNFSPLALKRRIHPSALPLKEGLSIVQERAEGCLFGQVAGDSLGSMVEYKTEQEIKALYPSGVTYFDYPNYRGLLPGQGTDDSEMALVLARGLLRYSCLNPKLIQAAYRHWLSMSLEYAGKTTKKSLLTNTSSPGSIANGALMRVAPLGVFSVAFSESVAMALGKEEAAITHSHKLCTESSSLYVATIRLALLSDLSPVEIYKHIFKRAEMMHMSPLLLVALKQASISRPEGYFSQMGYALVSLQNAFYELLHANSFEEAVEDSILRGGDTDTNGAICGALLGAVYGKNAVPEEWREVILACKPAQGTCKVPRPEEFWTNALPGLASNLISKAKLLPL